MLKPLANAAREGDIDPEWSDNYLTPEKIKVGNPLGHSLYENYIKKVIRFSEKYFSKKIAF